MTGEHVSSNHCESDLTHASFEGCSPLSPTETFSGVRVGVTFTKILPSPWMEGWRVRWSRRLMPAHPHPAGPGWALQGAAPPWTSRAPKPHFSIPYPGWELLPIPVLPGLLMLEQEQEGDAVYISTSSL